MKILYDHQIFSNQEYGGASRYFYELIHRLDKEPDISTELALLVSNNKYLTAQEFSFHRFFANYKIRGKQKALTFINRLYGNRLLKQGNYDLFHPSYYHPYFLKLIGHKPFVLTVHDMIHETFPELYPNNPLAEWKKMLALRADKIIAVSENTKKDILKFWDIDEDKIDVVYHGASFAPTLEHTVKGNYILYVGSRSRYKNFERFISACVKLLIDDRTLQIICTGEAFSQIESELFTSLNITDQLVCRNVDDKTLAQLYSEAICFVFPSLYEGFGIPILEAFSCQCPVVCSNNSSLPEVAGDAAIYFDPYDIDSMRNSIQNVINDRMLQQNMVERGNQRLKLFSWDQAVDQTKKVYKTII